MKCQEPGPPLLFTMIMKQRVMPRTTSSESSRRNVAGAAVDCVKGSEVAGVVIAIAVSVRLGLPITLRAEALVRQAQVSISRPKVKGLGRRLCQIHCCPCNRRRGFF